MGYYLMRVNRSSFADILVKADTLAHAEKRIDDWFDGRDNEDFNTLLSERDRDSTELKRYFPTIEEYNRSGVIADFEINMPDEPKEPRYDLYLSLDKNSCHVHKKVWQDLEMESVLNILREYNKQYVLKKNVPNHNVVMDAAKRNCLVIFYEGERRELEDRPDISSHLRVRFDTKIEADNVLGYLKHRIKSDGYASICDLDSVMLRDTEYKFTKYGWKDLTDARIVNYIYHYDGKEYFTILFPKVICLDD